MRPGQEWKVGEAQLSSIQACLHAAIAAAHARAGRAQDYRKHIEKAEALAKAIPGDINKMWAQMLSSVAKPDEGPGPDPTNAIYKSKAIESVVIARAQAGDHDGARRSLELIPAGRHRDARARLLVKALAEAGALEAARAAAEAITEDAVHRDLAFVSIVGAHARAGDLAGSRALAGRIRHGEYRLIAQMHWAAADRAGRGGDYAAVLRAAADSRLRPNLYRDLARIQAGAPSRREMAKWIAALGGAEARFHAFLGAGEGVMAAASKPASAPAAPARSQLGGAGPASAPAGSAELAAEETKKRMEQFARELEAPPR
ncbi:MAG: hypothetical protein AMJ81_07435 [Phycisphaerae bacterium SM23_33]|nr:MAG: hypothetical protein AMJ81_07435 [Phycisphaerae bacterium SM23_33]